MEYENCARCGIKFNVSALRDKSRVFICEDCVRRQNAKKSGKKPQPVYDRRGFASVSWEGGK